MQLFSRGTSSVVGLDIGSSSIKLVELLERKGELHLQRLGIEPLSPEAIVDGSIMDSSLVVDAIHRLNAQTKVKNNAFATSVSGHSVVIKKIQLPAMSEEELAESIQWEAEQYIPFDLNDVRLDYVVLSEGQPGRDTMEVLVVAIKRDKVNDYMSVIRQTGKTPVILDVDAFAVQNAYELNYDLDPRKVVALINMGADVTTINILARGATAFWRDLSFGGNHFTEALQRRLDLSFAQAEALKRAGPVDGDRLPDVRPVLDLVSAELASDIRKTFDFFLATSSEGPVDEVVLSGGCALTPNLQQVLRERLDVPTELMNPLRRIHFRESDFDPEWIWSIGPMMAVAVGLGVRKVDERAAPQRLRKNTVGRSGSWSVVHASGRGEVSERAPATGWMPQRVEIPADRPTTQVPLSELLARAWPLHEDEREEEKEGPDVTASIDQAPPSTGLVALREFEFDIYMCHATEDKPFVEPLANRLRERGLRVWYDSFLLQAGDRLRSRIDHGVSGSRFGIAVLSECFFRKDWTQEELDALFAQRKVIIPILHGITPADVGRFSPTLATRVALLSTKPLEEIVEKILYIVRGDKGSGAA